MFGQKQLKLDDGLYRKAKATARELGYSCVEEFVTHVLERELNGQTQAADDETLRKRLKGLGYLD